MLWWQLLKYYCISSSLGVNFDFFGIGEFWGCKSLRNDFGLQYRFFYYERASLIGGVALKAGHSLFTVMTIKTDRPRDSPVVRYVTNITQRKWLLGWNSLYRAARVTNFEGILSFSLPSNILLKAGLMQITMERVLPAWLRMTLDCSRIAKEIAMVSGFLSKKGGRRLRSNLI